MKKVIAVAILIGSSHVALPLVKCRQNVWKLPGGWVPERQDPVEAGIEMVKKQIGLTLKPRNLKCIERYKGDDYRSFLYKARIENLGNGRRVNNLFYRQEIAKGIWQGRLISPHWIALKKTGILDY